MEDGFGPVVYDRVKMRELIDKGVEIRFVAPLWVVWVEGFNLTPYRFQFENVAQSFGFLPALFSACHGHDVKRRSFGVFRLGACERMVFASTNVSPIHVAAESVT